MLVQLHSEVKRARLLLGSLLLLLFLLMLLLLLLLPLIAAAGVTVDGGVVAVVFVDHACVFLSWHLGFAICRHHPQSTATRQNKPNFPVPGL